MDFPTRGDSFVDNCFTNRSDLFGKIYPIKMLIKTDHLGFIVPAGKKLKPIECFHSRDQHLCKFIGTEESVCIRMELNSQRIGLGHQHGRRSIVLGHQYGRRDVMGKHSIGQKVQFRDCREHRKRALYLVLASECWDEVLEADNIETAVNILELKILSNINRCMP